jgi:hypothetical protein
MSDQPKPDAADPAAAVDAAPDAAEIERLRLENERLRHEVEELETAGPRQKKHWIRGTAVGVLLALGFLLVPSTLTALWTHNQLMNTNRYVQMVGPLADNPDVQQAVADDISAQVWQSVDVQALLQQYLPPKLTFAAPALANQVENQVNGLILKAVQSPEFATVWTNANKTAHQALVDFLNKKPASNVSISGDTLVVDLGPYIAQIKQRLIDAGISVASNIPDVSPSVTIPVANISALQKARQAVHVLNILTFVLPLLVLLCFGLALWLARDRRRVLIWIGVLIALDALVVGLGLAWGRTTYLGAATSDLFPASAAAAVWDQVVGFIKSGNRMIFALGVVIALAAAVTGPYPWATKLRASFSGAIDAGGQKTGLGTGPFGAWVARNVRVLRILVVVVAALTLVLWTYPTANVIIWLVVGVLVALAVIQFLAATGRQPSAQVTEVAPTDDAEPEKVGSSSD